VRTVNAAVRHSGFPIPRIPDCDHIESQADRQQEFVIERWIGGQANQVEQEKENGHDNIHPTTTG